MSQSNTPNRMTALGLLEQMRRANANREPEFNPINATLRGQRQPPLPIPPRPPAVIPPPQPQRVAPQARGQAQALPVPPVPPAVVPQQAGAEATPTRERFNPDNPYVATATQMAERYGLPRNVFLSLVQQESGFRPDAVSRAGALGLGQLMPGTARDLGVDPTNPVQNLEGSARYLRQQLDRFGGDMPLALAAYNAGPRRVVEAGNTIPNNAETQAYVPSVMRRAGVPGYAEGGPVDSMPVHEINVVATRLPRRRAPRPAPREELTADQLNAMVLDRLAARYDVAPESIMAAEARDRIGRAMGYAEGGLTNLHQKYADGGDVMSDEEYDRRLLGRMQRDMGRTDVPSWDEQRATLVDAAGRAARGVFDVVVPQTPLDVGLTLATGPVGSMVRRGAIAGTGYLLDPDEAQANVIRRVGRALGRAGAGSADAALEAAATPTAPTRRRGTIGIIPEETLRAPAVMPSAAREANAVADLQDETLRAYLDRNSTREPTVRTLPEGEDVLGLRNYDLSQVPDVPQVDLPRVVPPRGVSARMSDLVSNEDVWREYSDLVRNGRDNLQGREWYNMEPLRHAFVRELGEDEGTAAFRHYTQNIAATSPRSNIIDNMRNASYYFVQEPSGLILPVRQPAPYGHLAQNLHRQNVETIRSPEGWDLFKNPKPPSFAENLGGNQRPGTMDAHALSVPSILSRDPRFLTTDLRIPSGGGYFNLKPRASYGRGVFTMDEAVRRPQLWDVAPNPNEYGALEQRFRRLGEDLGMTTAQAQASGWVGGGRISGLTSPPLPAVDVFQRVVNRTAAQEGRSPQEVLRGFIHRQNALRAAAPIAIGVGANEELDGYAHGGLAQLHHKYAEGGAVSAQPAIYDPDAVNALANQIEADYV